MESHNSGHCEYFSNVKLNERFPKGSIQRVKIIKSNGSFLEGVSLKKNKERKL